MRRLRGYTKAAIVLLVLAALFIVVIASRQTFGEDNALGRAAGKIIAAVQAPPSYAGRFLSEKFERLIEAESLANENEKLREQIRTLENELIRNKLSAAELEELKKLSEALEYADLSEKYSSVTADVVALDSSNGFNIFTINAGTDRGVSVDSVIISGDGLVGRVMSAGADWAKVISIIDESNRVGFQVFRDTSWLGVCSGDGDALKGYMLDGDALVMEGDRLITSGIGGVYPEGIPVGKVTKVEWTHESPLKTIEIEPYADFNNIRRVTALT
ncbi:MAG: rod shape-determining protein MreC [Clostridiales Family XIII bacterium]|jgi:rod shape-determining protein MreC|nr:rod shape-determining protein MreC [Clostridiales Family XIII bacterium]